MMKREVWHVTEGLLFAHFAFYIMLFSGQGNYADLALIPGMVAARPWTLFSFQFLHGGMISFFFSMLILWIMARPLEESWGSPRFLLFYFVSILGAVGTALLFGIPLAGDIFLQTSLLFTFATIYPETEFLIFLILPVKVKYLAVIGGSFLVYQSLSLGLLKGAAHVVGMSMGYAFFLVMRKVPNKRKLGFELKKRKAVRQLQSEKHSAEQQNLAWDPAVRRAEAETREAGEVPAGMAPLLGELEKAVDDSVTICSPEDFRYTDDEVCRTCPGYPACALRAIRAAAADIPEESPD